MSTFYLNADTGVDSGAGGISTPWLTISYALAHSSAGDTLYLQNSVNAFAFGENVFTSARVIQGQSVTGVAIDGGSANVYWLFGNLGTLVVNNCTFQNISPSYDYVYAIFGFYTSCTGVITFNNCIFRNIILNNAGYYGGLFGSFFSTAYPNEPAFIANSCLFYGIAQVGGTTTNIFGGQIGSISVTLTNCTVHIEETANYPRYFACFTVYAVFKNTIFSCKNAATTWFYDYYSRQHATYCVFFNVTGALTGTGVITSDPLFVDPSNGNFSLRPTSPCIDAGSL